MFLRLIVEVRWQLLRGKTDSQLGMWPENEDNDYDDDEPVYDSIAYVQSSGILMSSVH